MGWKSYEITQHQTWKMCCWEALNLLFSFLSGTSTCKTTRTFGWPRYGHVISKDPKTKRYRCKWNSKNKNKIFQVQVLHLADICGSGFGGFLVARDIKNSWILQSCVLASFSAFKNHSQPKSHCQFPLHLECSSWCQFLFPSLSAHWRSSDNSYQNESSICIDKIAVSSRSCLISVSNQSFKFMALMDLIWSSFQLWSWMFRWGERKVGNRKQDMQLPPVCFFSAPAPEATIFLHQCHIKAFFTAGSIHEWEDYPILVLRCPL